jgi:hypothetical protein
MTAVMGTDKRLYSPTEVSALSLEVRWGLFPYCDEDYSPYVGCKFGFYEHLMCELCGRVVHACTYAHVSLREYPWFKFMSLCHACYTYQCSKAYVSSRDR